MRLTRTPVGEETGHRYELARQLDDMATGWHLRGNDAKSEDCEKGAQKLRDGAPEVTVGLFRYIVTD
jgi:hypothetical protein